jgi:hypothetical protein
MFALPSVDEIVARGEARQALRKAAMLHAAKWFASALAFLIFGGSAAYFIVVAPLWQFLCWAAVMLVLVVHLIFRGER